MHPDYDLAIAYCNKLDIPVLIDACYYVISGGVELDVTAECIDTVSINNRFGCVRSIVRFGSKRRVGEPQLTGIELSMSAFWR
jgi:hypothetical protein